MWGFIYRSRAEIPAYYHFLFFSFFKLFQVPVPQKQDIPALRCNIHLCLSDGGYYALCSTGNAGNQMCFVCSQTCPFPQQLAPVWWVFSHCFIDPLLSPPQKHSKTWESRRRAFLFELCSSCNPCTQWNAGGRQQSVITSRTANSRKKYSKRWNPGPNGSRRNLAVYRNGAGITPPAKLIRPWSLSIHLLLFSASNKHCKKIKKYQRSWLCYRDVSPSFRPQAYLAQSSKYESYCANKTHHPLFCRITANHNPFKMLTWYYGKHHAVISGEGRHCWMESSLKPLQLWLTCSAYGTSQLVCSSEWNWLATESILNMNFDLAWGHTYLLYHVCHHHHFDAPFLSALTKEKGFAMQPFPSTAVTIISSVLFRCRTIRKKTVALRH